MARPNLVVLRNIAPSDLPIFFLHQCDPDAVHMAAFTAKEPSNRAAFNAFWTRIMTDESIIIQTILYEDQVAGSVLKYDDEGKPEVSYWLGKEFWGKGIATQALRLFLDRVAARPLYARAAKDNLASIRVLEKCGFTVCGQSKGYANARGCEIEELLLVLGAA